MNNIISVIIPCYNQAKFLNYALGSVYKQSYNSWECIVIDDGSKDESKEVAERWCEKDKRFIYFFKENGGLSSARNFGIEKARGSFIQFLDADDFLNSKKLDLSIKAFLNFKSKKGIVISNFKLFNEKSQKFLPPYCNLENEMFNLDSILFQWEETFSIPIHCGLFHRSLFEIFTFHEDLRAKEDWIMWIELFQQDPEIEFLDEPLAFYRIHKESMTMSGDLFPDHMASLQYLKSILSQDLYLKLMEVLVRRYYKISLKFKKEVVAFQKTVWFQILHNIKKLQKKVIKRP